MQARSIRLLILMAVFLPAAFVRAAFEEYRTGVRAEGMGGAFTAIADDVSAIEYNPAGLGAVSSAGAAAFGRLLYGGVGVGLHTAHVAGCLPVGQIGTLAIRLQETGFARLSERSLRLGHGVKLADGLFFGYAFSGYNLSQAGGYGSGFAVGADVALLGTVYESWRIGFLAQNLNRPRIGNSALPQVLAFGLGYSPAPGINSALDVSKEPGRPARVHVGQEFRIVQDFLTLRAGVETEPVRFAVGFRTGLERVHLDYALKTHPVLPVTHTVGLAAEF